VAQRDFRALRVGHLRVSGEVRQGLEVLLARGAGGEQDQHGRIQSGLIAERVDTALGHIGEVTRRRIHPFLAVVEANGAGEDEE
jgi:hypothetical protein